MVAIPSLAVRCVRVFTMSLHMASAACTLVQWPLPILVGGATALVLQTLCRFLGLSRHPFILGLHWKMPPSNPTTGRGPPKSLYRV